MAVFMKKRLRAVGIILLNGGLVLIHRKKVKYKNLKEYYVLPGVVCENEEQFKETLKQEIFDTIGLDVNVKKLMFYFETEQTKEYFYLCEYISGKFKNVNGSESASKISHFAVKSVPEILRKNELENINIMPEGVKNKLLDEVGWE